MRWVVACLFLGLSLAGCISESGDEPEAPAPTVDEAVAAAMDAIGEPIVMDHDHNDAHLHNGSHNLELVAYSDLGVDIGTNGYANFVIWPGDEAEPANVTSANEVLLLIAIDGDAGGRAGFNIVDIKDPGNITVLGEYRMDGNSIQEVRVTPDGRFAIMNVQSIPNQSTAGSVDGGQDCTVCLHVFNIEDRTAPRWVSAVPVELLGTHNMHIEPTNGVPLVFYVGQPLYNPYPDPGNHVYIARFDELPGGNAVLTPIGDFAFNPVDETPGQRPDRIFPHDIIVQEHPNGRRLAYMSGWDAGMVIFDVQDPTDVQFLGRDATMEPSGALATHWAIQEPRARSDGRVIAWTAPEIGSLSTGTGLIRAHDVTDPRGPHQIGWWTLPGNLSIEGRYILSPHTAIPDMDTGLLAVAHYHAGVWVLDISDPEEPKHVAYYLPRGPEDEPISGPYWWKKPNFSPEGYGPNTYQARWHDGHLWVSDRGTGLYVLKYTGPVPGPL